MTSLKFDLSIKVKWVNRMVKTMHLYFSNKNSHQIFRKKVKTISPQFLSRLNKKEKEKGF